METITIPSSEIIASLAISILAVIVLWDAYWLTKQKRDIPELGKISDEVFVGSNSSLVAPVILEKKSVIGAGSVITKNVKKNSLALTRSPQADVKNYKRKNK